MTLFQRVKLPSLQSPWAGLSPPSLSSLPLSLGSFLAGCIVTGLFFNLGNVQCVSKEFVADHSVSPLDFTSCRNWLPPNVSTDDNGWDNGLKHVGRPAECSVKGFLIEELDPEVNFRRGFAYGHVSDVEDRTYLLPYFLAAKDPALQRRKRKIYLDLGGRTFDSSLEWFVRYYPLDFTEFHVFEVNISSFVIPPLHDKQEEALSSLTKHSLRRPRGVPVPVTNSVLEKVKLYDVFVSNFDGKMNFLHNKVDVWNITRFIKEELKATKDDTLIVKMDIEGAEYGILQDWVKDSSMAEIVDELFVEIHYSHWTMKAYRWPSLFKAHSRNDATQLLVDLRKAGFYVHAWP